MTDQKPPSKTVAEWRHSNTDFVSPEGNAWISLFSRDETSLHIGKLEKNSDGIYHDDTSLSVTPNGKGKSRVEISETVETRSEKRAPRFLRGRVFMVYPTIKSHGEASIDITAEQAAALVKALKASQEPERDAMRLTNFAIASINAKDPQAVGDLLDGLKDQKRNLSDLLDAQGKKTHDVSLSLTLAQSGRRIPGMVIR